MTITLTSFIEQMLSSPPLLIITILTMGTILVNGWTDAPNAIATCVSTRSMSPGAAILMAAIFNFFGVMIMTLLNAAVAQTIYNIVDFGGDSKLALIALCAALIAIIVWTVGSWWFGIPNSESHALIAGLIGAAMAVQGFSGINGAELMKVIYGLVLSTGLGFVTGWLISKGVGIAFANVDRRKTFGFFKNAQIGSAAGMAFMHGAQDGQKFMGVFIMGVILAQGEASSAGFIIPIWIMVVCSAVMGLGTSIGGYRIIKSVGMDMVSLEKYQGFSADMAAVLCLLLSSIFGIPVSTTHTKTTAIMGVGAAKRLSSVNWGVARNMVATWVMTFPGCGLIGYILAAVFVRIF